MAMFEQEIEMEKRQSSVVPLLLIVCLIISVVGVAGYYLIQTRKVVSKQEAAAIVGASLKEQGPATVRFRTGMIKASVDEKPHDPHYRLLEKAGLIKLGKDTGTYGQITPVMITSQGERLLAELQDVSKVNDKDGTVLYVVPIAQRRLVEVSKVTMNSPSRASVEFVWKWEPNKLGNLFDASGSMVKGFNTWDRATLIQKYGANFYHSDPTHVVIALTKGNAGWQINNEY
jgi:hypothetical protein